MRLGFIGTGTLSAAVIKGLAEVHGDGLPIVVSPRSDSISRGLAADLAPVVRCDTNQAVVDGTDIVVIAVRPQQMHGVLKGLRFRPDQTVVSFVAGATNDQVAALVAPARRVIRVTPLPMIADRRGPILIYPRAADIMGLFQGLGTVIVPQTQNQVMALGYAGGLMATFFEMTNTAADWLETQSLPRAMARDYLMSMYEALGARGSATPTDDLRGLPAEFSTPGGINERCHQHLAQHGWFDEFATGLEAMKTHLARLEETG